MTEAPSRLPIACGALGRYERDRVLAIGRALAPEMRVVHEDHDSILLLDREPVRWRGRRAEGIVWPEQSLALDPSGFRSRRDAAAAGCGLAIEGRRRIVHSSISGTGSLYHQSGEKASYFATRIDPLAMTSRERLTADVQAWASILMFHYIVNERTPFEEIRRLAPSSVVAWRRGTVSAHEERWPWAEIDPDLSVGEGARLMLDEGRSALSWMPEGDVVLPLSGGWDSRILAGLLAESRRDDTRAYTVNADNGNDGDERLARPVAAHCGLTHRVLAARADLFWKETSRMWLLTDFQAARHPWRMPIATELGSAPATLADGLALDTLAQPGGRFITEEVARARGTARGARAFWRQLRARLRARGMDAASTLRPAIAMPIQVAARDQLLAETRRFRGHPAFGLLSLYWTRTVRSISLTTTAAYGADFAIAVPFAAERVGRATLRVSPNEKFGARLYAELFSALDPALGALSSTNDDSRGAFALTPRRRDAELAVNGFRELLADGPLTSYLRPSLVQALTRGDRGKRPRTPLAALPAALFHAWCQHYANVLREVDPAAALGVQPDAGQARVNRRELVGEASSSSSTRAPALTGRR